MPFPPPPPSPTPSGTTSDRRDPWLGRTLDRRYRVDRLLGAGGMGSVYVAHDARMNRDVVVKVPHSKLLVEAGFRERFLREIRSLTSISHAHIVKVLDAGEEVVEGIEATPFAVLEYLEGGSLMDRLDRDGPSPVGDVLRWLPDVARALDFLHGRKVVHRDIKPGNILFDGAANAFIADFGIVKALGATEAGLTQTGATPGSPDYMAPEVVFGDVITSAYDQYALAVVVYQALCGHVPHEVPGAPMQVLVKKANDPPRPLTDYAPHVSREIETVVLRALSRSPPDRYASCSEFATALTAASQHRAPEVRIASGPAGVAGLAMRAGKPGPIASAAVATPPESLANTRSSPALDLTGGRPRLRDADTAPDAFVSRGVEIVSIDGVRTRDERPAVSVSAPRSAAPSVPRPARANRRSPSGVADGAGVGPRSWGWIIAIWVIVATLAILVLIR